MVGRRPRASQRRRGAAAPCLSERSARSFFFKGPTRPGGLPQARTLPPVDRGKGFYNLGNGKITAGFQAALKECGFKAFWGDDASAQPGHLQELMLHETVVSWLRVRLEQSLPKRPWEETPNAFAGRLRRCCAEINSELGVDGLCRAFPKRIQKLIEKKGGRLKE